MKRLFTLPVIILLIICLPIISRAESAKDVVKALMKLDAKFQTGLTRQDFSNGLADVKYEVKLFQLSEEVKKCPELTESIKKALNHYEWANEVLRECTGACIRLSVDKSLAQELLKLYPEAYNSPIYHVDYGNMYFLMASPLISLICSKASPEIENAMKLLTKCSQETNETNKEPNKKQTPKKKKKDS